MQKKSRRAGTSGTTRAAIAAVAVLAGIALVVVFLRGSGTDRARVPVPGGASVEGAHRSREDRAPAIDAAAPDAASVAVDEREPSAIVEDVEEASPAPVGGVTGLLGGGNFDNGQSDAGARGRSTPC
jgi:hypothetical protein